MRVDHLKKTTKDVKESVRIEITEQLKNFRNGFEDEIAFPTTFTSNERAFVHLEATRIGLTSKSRGKGESRQCYVTKKNDAPQGSAVERLAKASRPTSQRDKDEDASPFDLVQPFRFSESATRRLESYLERWPPTEAELAPETDEAAVPAAASRRGRNRGRRDGRKRGPNPTSGSHRAEAWPSTTVRERLEALERQRTRDPRTQDRRAALPIASFEEEIVSTVEANQVTLLVGETGCGKSTQLPQMVGDALWRAGTPYRMIVTQPRRISAMSVAERVAAERGEPIGQSVGYQIRLEKQGGDQSSIVFCTNGVALRHFSGRAANAGAGAEGAVGLLEGMTHLVIDEIHERDCFADFLLIHLKRLLSHNPALKVILMSANLEVDKFKSYFDGCPVIHVPGFTYPVDVLYIDDVSKLLPRSPLGLGRGQGGKAKGSAAGGGGGAEGDESGTAVIATESMDALLKDAFFRGDDADFEALFDYMGEHPDLIDAQHSETGLTALMIAAARGRLHECTNLLARGADVLRKDKRGHTAAVWAEEHGPRLGSAGQPQEVATLLSSHAELAELADHRTNRFIKDMHANAENSGGLAMGMDFGAHEDVDLELLALVISHICKADADVSGAILIFLPGWLEISQVKRMLEDKMDAGDLPKLDVLPLHSKISPAEQKLVFKPSTPAKGRKVVLSTNIAETSVTIEDIVYVVDSGLAKESSYDPHMGVSTLQTQWISKASANQRKGRAGRCQRGVCYRLYSQRMYEKMFADHTTPELLRSPLDELCLQTKLLDSGEATSSFARFLSDAVECPHPVAVENALKNLEAMGAIVRYEDKGGGVGGGGGAYERLTDLGTHLAALPLAPRLGKALLIAAMFNVFTPICVASCFSAYRDPWITPSHEDKRMAAKRCKLGVTAEAWGVAGGQSDHLSSTGAFLLWEGMRSGQQYRWAGNNFISSSTMRMVQGMRMQLDRECREWSRSGDHWRERGGMDAHLIRAVLAMGNYPDVGELVRANVGDSNRKASIATPNFGSSVRIAGHSVLARVKGRVYEKRTRDPPQIIAYDEVVRTEQGLQARVCSLVGVLPVVIIAKGIKVLAEEGPDDLIVEVDGWLLLRMSQGTYERATVLRRRFQEAFKEVVRRPSTLVQPPRSMQATLDTLRDMLAEDVIEAGGRGGGGMAGGRYVDDFEPVGGLDRGLYAQWGGAQENGGGMGGGGRGRGRGRGNGRSRRGGGGRNNRDRRQ